MQRVKKRPLFALFLFENLYISRKEDSSIPFILTVSEPHSYSNINRKNSLMIYFKHKRAHNYTYKYNASSFKDPDRQAFKYLEITRHREKTKREHKLQKYQKIRKTLQTSYS